jgi:hypothetical protein
LKKIKPTEEESTSPKRKKPSLVRIDTVTYHQPKAKAKSPITLN